LRTVLGKALPEGEKIGEAWELSDHPAGRSTVANGPYAGRLFGDLVKNEPWGMCRLERAPSRFPLLIKYIDASEKLSIQVHPDDEFARRYGDSGKTECWYIMDCPVDGKIICGVEEGVGLEELKSALADDAGGRLERCLHYQPIRPGAFVYIPAGTIHAILPGTLLCEIQQSSDLTYRIWDWDRKPPRPLHIRDALAVSKYLQVGATDPGAPFVIEDAAGDKGPLCKLARNSAFEVWFLNLKAGTPANLDAGIKKNPGAGLRDNPGVGSKENPGAVSPADHRAGSLENRRGVALNVVAGDGAWTTDQVNEQRWGEGEFRMGETWFLPPGVDRLGLEPGPAGLKMILSQAMRFGGILLPEE
jgi:mannose-6-phosphate isomerase